jgi:hypothetical protein
MITACESKFAPIPALQAGTFLPDGVIVTAFTLRRKNNGSRVLPPRQILHYLDIGVQHQRCGIDLLGGCQVSSLL